MSYKLKDNRIENVLRQMEACPGATAQLSKFDRAWKKAYDHLYGPRFGWLRSFIWQVIYNLKEEEYQFFMDQLKLKADPTYLPCATILGYLHKLPHKKNKTKIVKEIFTYNILKELMERHLGKPKSEWVDVRKI